MMRKFFLVALIALIFSEVNAQRGGNAPLRRGERQVNFGTGFSTNGLPVYGSVDFAVHKDITLTPEVHVRLPVYHAEDFSGGVLLKSDYHWNFILGIPPGWDFYTGIRLGLDYSDQLDPDLGIQVGGRWYWNDRWGINLEVGAGTGFDATAGFSFIL